jgi:hypothetical protein
MTTYSIGFMRDDGDFQLLATLNNNDGLMTSEQFEALKESLIVQLYNRLGVEQCIVCLKRQDAPDYVAIDENEGEHEA